MSDVELITLWPSLFLEADLPRHEDSTRRLIALARREPDAGVFAIDDPAIPWLEAQVARGVRAYLQRAGRGNVPEWGAQGRFVVLPPGGYRTLGDEPGVFLAGMYVLQWPSEHDAGGRRDDALPGCVSFYDPRVGMNMGAIKHDPYYRYHHSMQPRPGLLIMWPAHVRYFVHPNWSRHDAIAVRLRIALQRRAH